MMPDGLACLNSWLEKDGPGCFQLMETNEPSRFKTWFEHWKDLETTASSLLRLATNRGSQPDETSKPQRAKKIQIEDS
jgi:hypothetical protein